MHIPFHLFKKKGWSRWRGLHHFNLKLHQTINVSVHKKCFLYFFNPFEYDNFKFIFYFTRKIVTIYKNKLLTIYFKLHFFLINSQYLIDSNAVKNYESHLTIIQWITFATSDMWMHFCNNAIIKIQSNSWNISFNSFGIDRKIYCVLV